MTSFFILMVLTLMVVAAIAIIIVLAVSKKEEPPKEIKHDYWGDDEYSSSSQQQQQQGPRYCKYCGTQYEAQQAVCLNCGASVRDQVVSGMSNRQLAAGLLGIFLGVFGIHNFYLGNTEKAIAQLLLGTVGIVLIVGPVISSIWGLVEGILILTGNMPVDEN